MKVLVLASPMWAPRVNAVLRALGEEVMEPGGNGGAEPDLVVLADPDREQMAHLADLPGLPAIEVAVDDIPGQPGPTAPGRAPVYRVSATLDYRQVLDALYTIQCTCSQPSAAGAQPGGEAVLPGRSPAIRQLSQMLSRVADKSVTVLVTGPSGSGKELIARCLHELSPRGRGPFVPVNCGAIPRELLESELFGHERGAFTGAISARAGRFELAQGGTLFLDEIGDMPLEMQVKILRVLQERQFERVGSNTVRQADVRIVAATHRDLEAMIARGEFRADLYYRLNVFPLAVPALEQRREDIPHLVNQIALALEQDGLGKLRLTQGALDALCRAPWPGNIRELGNVLERLVILHGGALIGVAELPERYRPADWTAPAGGSDQGVDAPLDLKGRLTMLEQGLIEEALALHQGVVSRAADHLGLRRTTLIEKMRKLGIASRQ